jgi:hypothetical protein
MCVHKHNSFVLQAPAAKAGLGCLGTVLAAVEPGAWPAAAPGFQLLLSFLTDARPKVRLQHMY